MISSRIMDIMHDFQFYEDNCDSAFILVLLGILDIQACQLFLGGGFDFM